MGKEGPGLATVLSAGLLLPGRAAAANDLADFKAAGAGGPDLLQLPLPPAGWALLMCTASLCACQAPESSPLDCQQPAVTQTQCAPCQGMLAMHLISPSRPQLVRQVPLYSPQHDHAPCLSVQAPQRCPARNLSCGIRAGRIGYCGTSPWCPQTGDVSMPIDWSWPAGASTSAGSSVVGDWLTCGLCSKWRICVDLGLLELLRQLQLASAGCAAKWLQCIARVAWVPEWANMPRNVLTWRQRGVS